jgi:GrpB-like predicted nucleotidyltransferase (UPF0157 family)
MPSRAEIVSFDSAPPPAGVSAWVLGGPTTGTIEVTDPDPAWPELYQVLAGRIPDREQDYVPALESIGFQLVIREPWWYGHRALRAYEPSCNLHVFGFDSPEPVKHRIFRDWLRGNPDERDRYADAKQRAASAANAAGEHVMQYNARKEQVIMEIYHRAFVATGLLDG